MQTTDNQRDSSRAGGQAAPWWHVRLNQELSFASSAALHFLVFKGSKSADAAPMTVLPLLSIAALQFHMLIDSKSAVPDVVKVLPPCGKP